MIPDKWDMSDEDLICFCMSVTRGEIKSAIREGSDTIPKLKHQVSCCTGCGTCEERVRKILVETAAEAAAMNAALLPEKKSA